jgi:hypothetical protein
MPASLTPSQLKAVKEATSILENAGVSKQDLIAEYAELGLPPVTLQNPSSHNFLPLISSLKYIPPPSVPFSEEDIYFQKNAVTRQSFASSRIQHPVGAVVEFPESGAYKGHSIAHIFSVDPNDVIDPKRNIQYSLGGKKGGSSSVNCLLLHNVQDNAPARCRQVKLTCEFIFDLFRTTDFFFPIFLRLRHQTLLI